MSSIVYHIFCGIQTVFGETLDIDLKGFLFVGKHVYAFDPPSGEAVNIVKHESSVVGVLLG